MAKKKKISSITQRLAKKNKERREKGKQTSSKDLPPGQARNAARAIEKRKKRMQMILNKI